MMWPLGHDQVIFGALPVSLRVNICKEPCEIAAVHASMHFSSFFLLLAVCAVTKRDVVTGQLDDDTTLRTVRVMFGSRFSFFYFFRSFLSH